MNKIMPDLRAELIARGDISQFQARVNVETEDGQISVLMTLLVHEFEPIGIDTIIPALRESTLIATAES